MKIILTGASSGIGHRLAHHLLSNEHSVWGMARSSHIDLQDTHPGRFFYSSVDISHWDKVAPLAKTNPPHWTSADALIACAGIQGEIARTLTSNPTRWHTTVRSNLEGTYNTLRALYPLLQNSSGRAKIVCFSGGGATKPRPNFSAYGTAKTGIVRLVETIADEERDHQLDINAIAPGAINTRLTDEVLSLGPDVVGQTEYTAALKQKAEGGSSLKKVCGLVDWLVSSESDGVSGKLISAQWDPWKSFSKHRDNLDSKDVYTLRRVTPED